MSLARLAASELPELEEFFRALALKLPSVNVQQFCAPRRIAPGFEVATLIMRDAGRIVGTVGWVDVPMNVNDERGASAGRQPLRWPMNLYLLPAYRGKGLGKRLMEATREGVVARAVIGGNDASRPVLDRTGFRVIGNLSCARWLRPCLDPRRLGDRLVRISRRDPPREVTLSLGGDAIVARRVERLDGWLPWAEPPAAGAPGEAGVPRDAAYLEFAFGGALRGYHSRHAVTVNGALAGFFALAARGGRRGWLVSEIVDLDAVVGREAHAIAAARATALRTSDLARLRISGERFTRALETLGRGLVADHPLRFSHEPGAAIEGPYLTRIASWRVTYGDHDQYRVRPASLAWAGDQESPPERAGADR